ncbi:hypothetical protein J5N97_008405 [Dioscorea zingiberensis]|uniref:Uncharacterized protein n=1 Tax=Dioscorea zingiberensis TaxID=325984 RepID=A0A9D5CUM4_9LILI|nr:hypothetical protein J5N97_008405 [Dioscorea zingiberensis]
MFTTSNTSGHRRIGSGELDVFEAARYFSGDIDGLALGFGARSGAERKNRSCLEIPTQAMPLHVPPNLNQKQHKLEKRCKPQNSPTAKLANYLNSFLLQRSSKKKSKSNSNSKCITTKTRNTSQSLKSDHHHESMSHYSQSIRSYSDCSKSYYSNSGFGTPTQAVERTISADGFFGNRSQYHTRIHKDCFSENKNINQYRIKGRKSCYKKDGGDEGEDDGESDSSSDLFELRNMDAIADGPSELPVYGTTSFEVLKREAAIAG